MNLRHLAKGRRCLVRIPEMCDDENVILAHWRQVGISGMGLKSPDLIAAYACGRCHAYIDTHHDDETQLAFAKGVFRTQALLNAEERVKW